MPEEFNLPKAEEKILEFWRTKRIFEKSLEKTKKGKPFTFYDGPPFATGLPHYGHILASTIKDVVPRYETMMGRFVRRRWGWDCHGLPIEEIVERKLGISGKKDIERIGIKKFNETCRSMVLEYAEEWGKMVRRIARWTDFEDSYKTMDSDYMESVWWAFKQIYDKGLVYEGRKVLLYCPRCETPVSNFEVAMDNSYQNVTEESVTVRFRVKSDDPAWKNTSLLSWTTTPWTLPGNVALAVNPAHNFVCIPDPAETNGWLVLEENSYRRLAKDGVLPSRENISPEKFDVFSGKELVGLEYRPLFEIPAIKSGKAFHIYGADFVTTDEGTGIVHTAVVYGEEDYELGVREDLPVVPLLDEKGKFNEQAPELIRGKYFKDSEKAIKDDLEKRGLLFKRESHAHSYPYCWRCGNALFYNAIPAWFINIQKIKPKLLKSNKREINWFPAHLKLGRYKKSVEAAPDWNISRNRYWGNPIPVWRCKKCSKEEAIGSLKEMNQKAGGPKNKYWTMRHGESFANAMHIIDDRQKGGIHLTARGQEQAKNSAAALKKQLVKKRQKIDLIIFSDIPRARETARIAAEILVVNNVLSDKRLEEVHLGVLEGCHDKRYHELYPTYESKFEGGPDGGESLRDLRRRVWNFLADCERKYHGKNILLVNHEYPIWMLEHAARGWSEKRAIAEKVRRGKDYVKLAQVSPLEFRIAPRNDGGEVDFHRPYIDDIKLQCSSCKREMDRVPEIFDSWMEAGSMPFAEYHYPFENKKIFESRFPAQFVAEYIAQTRAWFYVMHVVSLILFGKAPFENVVTTGTILAGDGSKMSKSKGNFPDPWEVIEKYGADSLRFYLMNSVVMQADNLNFSEKEVGNIYRKVVLILRNVYNYFATYAPAMASAKKAKGDPGHYGVLDSWISARTNELVGKVSEYLNAYDTVRATRVIQEYIDDLSTWYLRRSRKRKDAAFFSTLHECLMQTARVIAPFMPFLAEELYQDLRNWGGGRGEESVHLEGWPKAAKSKWQMASGKLLEQMAEVRRLASVALAKRAEAGIKVRQPLVKLQIANRKPQIAQNKALLEILKDEINVKEIVFNPKISDEVELDTKITPELKEEGTLRELVRAVQDLRQRAGLRPKDVIVVALESPEPLRGIVMRNEKLLKSEVGAKAVEYKRGRFDAEIFTEIDGEKLWLAVRKI